MTTLKTEDMAPMANPAKVIGEIKAVDGPLQAVAADAAAQYTWTADFDGTMGRAIAVKDAAVAAAGEGMTFDLLKNGVSILRAVGTMSDLVNPAVSVIELDIDPTLAGFVAGDVFTTTRDYTAGGGPTPMANTRVKLFPTTKWWKT